MRATWHIGARNPRDGEMVLLRAPDTLYQEHYCQPLQGLHDKWVTNGGAVPGPMVRAAALLPAGNHPTCGCRSARRRQRPKVATLPPVRPTSALAGPHLAKPADKTSSNGHSCPANAIP